MNLDRIGKYRVVGKIGKGAMGEVYKAQDPLLHRFVAIKTIAPALAADPTFRRRFQREAQSAARLNHPNIVTVFDFGEEDGLVYMAMELLEGRDLKDLVRSGDATFGDKFAIMEQLCEGLGFAHAKGIVHRDLKPGNIHVQPNGQVKILDFGLARLGDSDITRTGTVMGTPSYMSPEQVRGEQADARSDVFSLGAVFYELLCRHRPFEAGSDHDARVRIVAEAPDPIRKWAPEVPAEIVAIVERALAKDPAHRFADGGEMGRALAAARDLIEDKRGVGPGRTLLQGDGTTVALPTASGPAYGGVLGATALTLAGRPAPAPSRVPPTVRLDPTFAERPDTHAPARAGRTRGLFLGIAVLVLAGIAAGIAWRRGHTPAPDAAQGAAEADQGGSMADVFAANQVELARADLADRDFAAAARRAEEVLKLNPASADAREVLDRSRKAQREIEDGVVEARAAFGRGDLAGASEALGRVMALAPRHPVVAELSAALEQHLRPQAESSRRQAEDARRAAEAIRGTAATGFRLGRQLAAEADALYRQQDYASAAQKYLESRDAFERVRRDADEARAAAARPSPSAAPTSTPVPAPVAATAPATPVPTIAPTVAPEAAPAAASPAAPLRAGLAPPSASQGDVSDAAVRRVIAEYGRAIGSQDLALFRSLKPDLTADEEKRLREAFKAVKSQTVGIAVESIEIDGDRATVRVTRQDVVNGRPMKPTPQAFRLARTGGSWVIQSIGQ